LDTGIGKINSALKQKLFNQNQIGATINLFLIDLIDGKVTEEEKQHMRKYLLNIMKRTEMPYAGVDTTQSHLDRNSKIKIQKTE
jgi:hypothetical protein